jgi:peptidyl-prolyl cis-trans isomerase SurA
MRIGCTSPRRPRAAPVPLLALLLALGLAGPALGPARAADDEAVDVGAEEVGELPEDFVDGIAAQVGSDIVLASEVYRFSDRVERKMREAGAPESEIAKMHADVLERMIERRLIEQAVRRVEIDATDAEIDGAIANIADENGLTLEQLRQTVEAKGLTYEAYREQIRGEIQRQKLVAGAVQAQIHVDEQEIRDLYAKRYADQPKGGEEVRLRHILVPFGADTGMAEEEACAKARHAHQRVRAGADFAEVASEISAVNARFGGDVGWVHLRNLAAWMAVPVSGMKAGEMSDVIRMPFGCNVLFLVQRRSFQPLTYEQAREPLREELFEKKMAEEYQIFVDTLRERTYIERKGMFAGAAPTLSDSSYQP